MDATARLIAIIALTSFATERLLACASFLFRLEKLRSQPDGAAERAEMRQHLLLFTLGGAIALAVVVLAGVRILRLVNPSAPPALDLGLTWLVIFAGADRVRALLQVPEKSANKSEGDSRVRIEIDRDGTVHYPRAAS